MPGRRLLLVNALLVNEGETRPADLLIEGGRIARIGADLQAYVADEVIDAGGRPCLPGMIDDQVHFREPGMTHKADIASESRAAVKGGITSYLEMPNTQPATTTLALLEEKYARAASVSAANYSFYLGATADNLAEIRALDARRHCGVKVFLGASTGDLLVDDEAALRRIFAEVPTVLAAHCEDTPRIRAREAEYRTRHGEEVPMAMHAEIRDAEACFLSSSRAVALARELNTRLHVLHLSTARELALFPPGPVAGKRITAEACVHHLYFSDADYEHLGARIKCNPAIKTEADRLALLQGLQDGRIDVVGTDHAPHTLAEKAGTYFLAPAGLPLAEYALPCLLEHVHRGVLTLPQVAALTAHQVARCFRIAERGFVREGYFADLVLLDPHRPHTVGRKDILSLCGWSPFEGRAFESRVWMTIVSGQIAYRDGAVQPGVGGQRLAFHPLPV
jgi:dihydroorotase